MKYLISQLLNTFAPPKGWIKCYRCNGTRKETVGHYGDFEIECRVCKNSQYPGYLPPEKEEDNRE